MECHKIDLEGYPRRDQFHYSRSTAQPYAGVTVAVDITNLRGSRGRAVPPRVPPLIFNRLKRAALCLLQSAALLQISCGAAPGPPWKTGGQGGVPLGCDGP